MPITIQPLKKIWSLFKKNYKYIGIYLIRYLSTLILLSDDDDDNNDFSSSPNQISE